MRLFFVFCVLMCVFYPFGLLAGVHENFLQYQGQERRYLVYTPEIYNEAYNKELSFPVVFIFHGGGGHEENAMNQTAMNETAEKYGFIAVYPDGTSSRIGNFRTWNVGNCCGRARKDNIDDVGFVSQMIDALALQYKVDTRRVYATGHSNGGMMSFRLACDIPNKIAAIAPNGGVLASEECRRSKVNVPTLHFHGTEDACAVYKGGEGGQCFGEMMRIILPFLPNMEEKKHFEAVPDNIARWAKRNDCSSAKAITFQKGAVVCEAYQNCAADVTLCSIDDGGHTWPGGYYGLEKCRNSQDSRMCKRYVEIVGEINKDVNANEMMWQFFSKHTLD